MISIRLRLEITTPTGEVVKTLPVLPGELMVAGLALIDAAYVKEIDVNGEAIQVERLYNTTPGNGIQLRLYGAADDFPDGQFIALVVDIVDKPGEEPGK